MELRALWKIGRRRWWLILIPALVAGVAAAYGYLQTPSVGGFSTSVRFTAATPPEEAGETGGYEDSEYYPWLTSEYVVNALTDWVRTSSFAEEVSAVLSEDGVEMPPGVIQAGIAADNERSVMVLIINGGDAEQVGAIAQAAGVILEERAPAYFPQFGEDGTQVVLLDTPVVVPVPPPVSVRLEPLVRFGLGLAAGIALAFLVEYLDPTVRDRGQIEALGLAVIAEIPRHK